MAVFLAISIHSRNTKASSNISSASKYSKKAYKIKSLRFSHFNIMCWGVQYIHAECQHDRKTEIVEHCEDSDQGTCILIPVHFMQITAPSLCVSCFREDEAKIDARYHGKVEVIRSKMVEYEAAQTDRQIRGRAQGTTDPNIAQLERDLVEAKKWRDRAIKVFRFEQGVWADG